MFGSPVIVTVPSVSSPKAAVSVAPSVTVPPSFTVAAVAPARMGATGFTVNAIFCDTEMPVAWLVAVAVKVAVVIPPAFKVSPASWAVVSVTLPSVTVSAPLLSLKETPDGMPLSVTSTLPPDEPPLTNSKLLAVRDESVTPTKVMLSAASTVMTVFDPTCLASDMTAAKLENWLVENSILSNDAVENPVIVS